MRRLLILLSAAAMLMAACSSSTQSSDSSASTATPSAATSIDGMVDVGVGRRIHATCAGFDHSGATVVLISDAQAAGDEWSTPPKDGAAVLPQVAAFAPVCAYDRPGTLEANNAVSPSTRVSQPTSAADGVTDLHAWLTAAQVRPPYVLVGHGWGGMIATLYAATYPSSTAGLVLVDPASGFLRDTLSDAQWRAFVSASSGTVDGSGKEVPDYANSVDVVRVARVGDIPTVILTASVPFDAGAGIDAFPQWQQAESTLASSLRATQITDTKSGHAIPVENPGAVVSALRQVLGQVG